MPKPPSRNFAVLKRVAASQSGAAELSPTGKSNAHSGRIMYIERKAGELTGAARIGRVTFSQTGRTLYYRGKKFQSLKGAGPKSNFYDLDSGEDYWISGPNEPGGAGPLKRSKSLKNSIFGAGFTAHPRFWTP